MAKYRVTTPDGRVLEVEAPDDASQADVIAAARKQPAPEAPKKDGGGWQNSFLGGVVRGARDTVDAGAQMLVRALPSGVVEAGDNLNNWLADNTGLVVRTQNTRKIGDLVGGPRDPSVDEINRRAEQDYQQNWRQGGVDGIDWGRITGQTLSTLPLTPGVGTAATMGGRAAQAARAGAVMGAFTPVEQADSDVAFWAKKAGQSALGAVTGAVAAPVVELGIKGAVKAGEGIADVAGRLTNRTSEAEARSYVARALESQGIDYTQVRADVFDGLVKDARVAMQRYGGADPAAIARMADFRELGVNPLKPWVTRDPVAFTRAENLAGINGVGEPLQRTRSDLNRALIAGVDRGSQGTAYDLGVQARGAIGKVNASDDAAINHLYKTFREQIPDVSGNGARLVDDISRTLDEAVLAAPGAWPAKFQALFEGKMPVDFGTLEKLRKAANAQLRGAKGGDVAALGHIKDAIDREMFTMAEEAAAKAGMPVPYNAGVAKVGELTGRPATASEALSTVQQARDLFRQTMQKREAAPALAAGADGRLTPETFFADHIRGGSVEEVRALWKTLPDEGRAAMRAMVFDEARKAAIGSASPETGTFSASNFAKFMQAPGMKEKLATILGPRDMAALERIQRAADNANRLPAGHKVNTSNSSQAVANVGGKLIDALGKIPGVRSVGAFAIEPARRAVQGAEAEAMAGAGARQMGVGSTFWDDPRRRAAYTLSGLLALPATGAAYTPFR